MKANRCFRQDEGVSNVLGGVLFFGILVMFIVTIQIEFVPKWTEEKEAAHNAVVQGQLTSLKGEIDRQAGNRSQTAAANPITLGERDASRLFSSVSQPGSMEFVPGTAGARVQASEMRVIRQGIVTTYATGEDWEDATSSPVISDVFAVQHLRLRIDDPGNEDDGDNVILEITDANGPAGSYTFYKRDYPSGHEFASRVTTADGTVIVDQGEGAHQQSFPAKFWVDLLSPELHFSDVLAVAEPPFTLTLTENSMDAEYTISYLQTAADGSTVIIGNAGELISNYDRSTTGGRLSVSLPTQVFPQQEYLIENTGVLRIQDDGGTMFVNPTMTVEQIGAITKVRLTVAGLVGEADAVTELGTVSIDADGLTTVPVIGTAPDLQYTVTTEYPEVWERYFTRVMTDAGLSEAASQFTVSTTATSCTLRIDGLSTDATHDLSLEMTRSSVQLTFQT